MLVRLNTEASHTGASVRFSLLEEIAHTFAFALKVEYKAGKRL